MRHLCITPIARLVFELGLVDFGLFLVSVADLEDLLHGGRDLVVQTIRVVNSHLILFAAEILHFCESLGKGLFEIVRSQMSLSFEHIHCLEEAQVPDQSEGLFVKGGDLEFIVEQLISDALSENSFLLVVEFNHPNNLLLIKFDVEWHTVPNEVSLTGNGGVRLAVGHHPEVPLVEFGLELGGLIEQVLHMNYLLHLVPLAQIPYQFTRHHEVYRLVVETSHLLSELMQTCFQLVEVFSG
jgi:hypothetical protein